MFYGYVSTLKALKIRVQEKMWFLLTTEKVKNDLKKEMEPFHNVTQNHELY